MAVVTLHERTTVEQRRQQLYDRLCQLMERQQPYTDETLNRHKLAAMLATNHSVTLIAALSGFSTRAYLYKQFRRHFQMTPTQYRQTTQRRA